MPASISPIELEDRLLLMADGIYRQLISISRDDIENNPGRAIETREIANQLKDKIKKWILESPSNTHYDELYDLYIQVKYIQTKIVRRSSSETLNRSYIREWING